SRRRIALLTLAVVALGLAAPEPPKPDINVDIRVVAIVAHNRSDVVDPRLKKLAAEVRKTVPQLTGFEVARQSCKPVAVNGSETFELVDGQSATVTFRRSPEKGNNQIELKLPQMDGELSEVTYSTTCNQFLPIITKYRTNKNHDVLIVAICVRPC